LMMSSMLMVSLRDLSKVIVISHHSSACPMLWGASFPAEKYPILRHVPMLHPQYRRPQQGPGQHSASLRLFHFAKGICSLPARVHARSCRVLTVLHQLRMEMMVPDAEPEQADVVRPYKSERDDRNAQK
jgi:hypothetical protein